MKKNKTGKAKKIRCEWVPDNSLYRDYHDKEWGVSVHDDRRLFEFLILEGMQAGLSWSTILNKRENFRAAFDNFDAEKIAEYDERKIEELISNIGIIRNRRKIEATIKNARAFITVTKEFGSFDIYIWQFVGGKPKKNSWKSVKDIPAKTTESEAMSKNLSQRDFKFIGPTICYAFMQAVGMVNDHTVDCFRHKELNNFQG